MDRLGYRGRLRSLAAMQVWNDQIAPCLKTESRATFIRGKVLYITVEKPVWAQQLTMMRQELIDRINASAGEGAVCDIRFRTGQIREAFSWGSATREEAAADSGEGIASPFPEWTSVEPDADARARTQAAAQLISDDELRSRFQEFMLLDAKYRTWSLRNLAAGAAQAADILRREPWLSDDHLRSLVPAATTDDLMRAREAVAAEFCDEARARMAAAVVGPAGRGGAAGAAGPADAHAGSVNLSDAGQCGVELRLLIKSAAMLLSRRPPEQLDESLVVYAVGEEFASYVRQAK